MPRDTLFLLPPGFAANGQREFCPVYVGIDHPRAPITALLGDGRHNAPTLVLHAGSPRAEGIAYAEAGGHTYLPSARSIAMHFAALHGTPVPRGH
jgi:hypothetical protein